MEGVVRRLARHGTRGGSSAEEVSLDRAHPPPVRRTAAEHSRHRRPLEPRHGRGRQGAGHPLADRLAALRTITPEAVVAFLDQDVRAYAGPLTDDLAVLALSPTALPS
ncbi:hypothetical protein [Saccharothrix sp. ST-888]|uniref:hypothetical protein n=1 Tax=Saccharothrix sp. ST-888 TaxID=1427391 RepID=UPI0012E066DE|nr:hypothetical protein [Saccharothrix sp. ST-888]